MSAPANRLQSTLQRLSKSKWSLVYDILMVGVIVISLLLTATDSLLLSHIGQSAFELTHHAGLWTAYQQTGHAYLQWFEELFIGILVAELGVRWIIAILGKYYYRWFFFPFVHWYEVLAIFPALRPLRLIRVFSIGYRLNKMGYAIIPRSWIKVGRFYYDMILEEISDRIVINVIDGIERELKEGEGQKQLIYNLIDRHRALLGFALADTLEKTIKPLLAHNQTEIAKYVQSAVQDAVWKTTEVKGLVRQLPFVSSKIEQTVEKMTGSLATNVTNSLIQPFIAPIDQPHLANPLYTRLAGSLSDVSFESDAVESLVKSVVFESLSAIKQQVGTQQWKLKGREKTLQKKQTSEKNNADDLN